jgi:hypothetical protein
MSSCRAARMITPKGCSGNRQDTNNYEPSGQLET